MATIIALGNLQAKEALPTLLQGLRYGSTSVRNRTLYSLAQIIKAHPHTGQSSRTIQDLVKATAQKRLRSAAKEALILIGNSATPFLLAQLKGELAGNPSTTVEILQENSDTSATPALIDELQRGRVLQLTVLSALESADDNRALLPVLALLEDPAANIRRGAMRALGNILHGQVEAADIIEERLSDTDPKVAYLAAKFLGRIGSHASLPALKKLVRTSKRTELQNMALLSIGEIGHPNGSKLALEILEGKQSKLYQTAANVLAEIGNKEVIPALLALTEEGQQQQKRQLAIEAIGAILHGSPSKPLLAHLKKLTQDSKLPVSVAAIEALASLGDPGLEEFFQQYLQHATPGQRQAAIASLGTVDSPDVRNTIHTIVSSGTDLMAAAAIRSLLYKSHKQSLPYVRQACLHGGPATQVNASAFIAQRHHPKDRDLLLSLSRHRNPFVRSNAILGLALQNPKKNIKFLEKTMIREPHWAVRIAAMRGLNLAGKMPSARAKSIAAKSQQKQVRHIAHKLATKPFIPSQNYIWKAFRIVNALAKDKKTEEGRAHYFIGSNGLTTVGHSDLRGKIYYHHFPVGFFFEGSFER